MYKIKTKEECMIKTLKQCAALAILYAGAVHAVPSELVDMRRNLLNKLAQARENYESSQNTFRQLKNQLHDLVNDFDNIDSKREEAFACIKNKFNTLKQNVADCLTGKTATYNQGELDKQEIRNEINRLKADTDEQINGLHRDIDDLHERIDRLRTDLSTLSSMSEEAVNQALSNLAQARTLYAGMLVDRQALVDQLNTFLTKLQILNFANIDGMADVAELLQCSAD